MTTGGVAVQGVRSNRDTFAERRLWSEQPLEQEQSATVDLLGAVHRETLGLDQLTGARVMKLYADPRFFPDSGEAAEHNGLGLAPPRHLQRFFELNRIRLRVSRPCEQ